ncbi:hypothetical protein COOONC_17571 [Cooperia oncophora]
MIPVLLGTRSVLVGWTPVCVNQCGRTHPSTGSVHLMKGGRQSTIIMYTMSKCVPRGDSTHAMQSDQPQLHLGQRFANRGRGGSQASARGGGVTGTSFNSRAQGLYDPRDPKDRPRNRMRSTSDEGDVAGEGGWTTASVGKHGWTQNKDGGQQNTWSGGQGGHSSSANETEESHRKSESGSMPEWMEDGEDQDKEESGDEVTSATGSFDEHGRFRKKVCSKQNNMHHASAESPRVRKAAEVTENKHERQTNNENQSTEKSSAPRDPNPPSADVKVPNVEADSSRSYLSVRQQSEPAGYHPSMSVTASGCWCRSRTYCCPVNDSSSRSTILLLGPE